ncbi:ATP/GTP-binding protein [Streptomyces sp. NPDC056831]|uniref:AAA family ATPase n=1 Tax=Streptomyces sp. NPDC056831 TaxID=3345954 RepID=UPI00367B4DFD
MLLRFRVANVRSLRDEQELTFVAPPSAPAVRIVTTPDGPLALFPLVGIFGANASGKSNVLAALSDMRDAVLNSYAQWAARSSVPRHVFALDSKSAVEPAFFEADVLIGGERWTYGFELGEERVEAEWVHRYPRGNRHRQEWLDRDASRQEPFRWPGNRVRDRAQLARRTRPDALLLSTAGTDNHPQLSPLFDWFRRNLWPIGPEIERSERERFTAEQLSGLQGRRIRELLQVADLGIAGAVVEDGAQDRPGGVRLLHRTSGGEVPLDWEQESYGTRSWFALLGPLLLALDQGAVLLLDELDASLHPRMAAEVIRIFHDPEANPKCAQLVFTSHDATLLGAPSGERLLEPEQIWLTQKDADGATHLYALTEADPGPEENLAASYLEGVFGAVPDLLEGQIALRVRDAREAGGN